MKQRLYVIGAWLLCIPTSFVGLIWAIVAGMRDPTGKRAWSILRGFDQMANAMLGGHEDDTVSYTIALRADAGERWAKAACYILGLFDKDHCNQSLRSD